MGIILLSAIVLGRAFYIQRFQGAYWRGMSDSLHQRFIALPAERGTIFSEDGQMLSISIPTFDITIDLVADGLREKNGKRFRENLDSFSIAMANYFKDKTAKEYKRDLETAYRNNERNYPLQSKLSFAQYKVFREFPLAKLGKNKSGIKVDVKSKRLTPYQLLANRTIGLSREHVDADKTVRKQNVGLEKSYDSVLSGRNGQKLVRFIAGGTAIPVEGQQTDPENGKDIYTTIDVKIQDITETALMRMMQQCGGPYGTAIVMETSTGKIKAMANLGRQDDGSYWEDDNYALRVTEPGSTIKLATLLSVLESGSSKLNDMVDVGTSGRAQVGPDPRNVVTDAEHYAKSPLTVEECFAHSSNVGMSKLAYKAFGSNRDEFRNYLHKFHLDERSPVDLSNVPKPYLASFDKGAGGMKNMIWMSFGYSISLSPLNTLTLYNAVANNGRMMKPYLVNSIQQNGIVIKQFQPQAMEEQLCKPEVIAGARASMEMVVTEGTAKRAFKDMPFAVAGKTGTAHVADGKIKYADGVYQATFVGYFPADQPQYTCIVIIRTKAHDPVHFGGSLAAPVFREIATKLYSLYVNGKKPSMYAAVKDSSSYYYAGFTADLKKVYESLHVPFADSSVQQTWSSNYAVNYKPVIKANPVQDKVMPNVKGMGLKDALYLLENMGVRVQVRGRGKIVGQSLPAGTALNGKQVVVLVLS